MMFDINVELAENKLSFEVKQYPNLKIVVTLPTQDDEIEAFDYITQNFPSISADAIQLLNEQIEADEQASNQES